MYFTYKFLSLVLYPIFLTIFFLRILLAKENWKSFKEKFLFDYKENLSDHGKLIWFHAASIGEVQSIFPLIKKLNNENKNLEFLITTVTLSSGNIVKKRYLNYKNIKHRYFPLDVNFLIKSFLNKWKPNLVIFIDSEIWPNLIFEIKKRKTPIALINGRITKKTFNKWMLLSKFAKQIFNSFDLCLASSEDSENNLKTLSVKNLMYIGNIKFSGEVEKRDLVDKNLEILKEKKFWCAASTHKGEENICLKTHINLKKTYSDLVTVIIPRHINRCIEISDLCKKHNLSSQILNDKELIKNEREIIIINSFGALSKFFNYSKSVFIGKSMIKKLEKVSGQNPIEAAKLRCKIYHGPYVYNFKEIYDLLKSYKISEEVNDEKELYKKLTRDLKNSEDHEDKTADIINDMGQKILDKTTREINKLLI